MEERLRHVRLFEFLTEEEREEFAEGAESVAYMPGETIIAEGREPAGLFIITCGRVEVSKRLRTGRDRALAELAALDEPTVVGERELLGEGAASASVRALSRVEAIRVPRESFRRMISEGRPAAFRLSYRIARTLAGRLTRLDEEVVEAIRELERDAETDLDAFGDRLVVDWAV